MPDANRTRNARGEGERLRRELLDAAVDLLTETGSLERTSLRAVASRARVSPTAVYRHFDDHTDLIDAAVAACWHAFTTAIAPPPSPDSPAARFRDMGRRYIEFATDQPGMYRVLFTNRVGGGAAASQAGSHAFELLLDAIADVLETNGDERDPAFVAHQVHAWIHGIVDLWDHTESSGIGIDAFLDEIGIRLDLVDVTASGEARQR